MQWKFRRVTSSQSFFRQSQTNSGCEKIAVRKGRNRPVVDIEDSNIKLSRMGPGATYAVATFLAGVLCLLGWLYATAGDSRSPTILKKSLWLIVLPILLIPLPLSLGMWALVAFEEGVKAFASTREQNPTRKFWLVSLFGVWELMLDKPFWGLIGDQSAESWDQVSLIGLVLATMIPVLMHAVTAAIYAFWFAGRLWAAFIMSWIIHMVYNGSVDYFALSPAVDLARFAFLALLLAALVAKRPRVAIADLP